jgi:hypothetical protein
MSEILELRRRAIVDIFLAVRNRALLHSCAAGPSFISAGFMLTCQLFTDILLQEFPSKMQWVARRNPHFLFHLRVHDTGFVRSAHPFTQFQLSQNHASANNVFLQTDRELMKILKNCFGDRILAEIICSLYDKRNHHLYS